MNQAEEHMSTPSIQEVEPGVTPSLGAAEVCIEPDQAELTLA